MLEIDISGSNNEIEGEDQMKIKLKSQTPVQVNFSKFLFRSKYVSDKCSEIIKSIEREITELLNTYEIQEEIIQEFIEIISNWKYHFFNCIGCYKLPWIFYQNKRF